jgi:hypothetical protein
MAFTKTTVVVAFAALTATSAFTVPNARLSMTAGTGISSRTQNAQKAAAAALIAGALVQGAACGAPALAFEAPSQPALQRSAAYVADTTSLAAAEAFDTSALSTADAIAVGFETDANKDPAGIVQKGAKAAQGATEKVRQEAAPRVNPNLSTGDGGSAEAARKGRRSRLNPGGAPTFADGAETALVGAGEVLARAGTAVADAQRGVTKRSGAVDNVKQNARDAAPYFGKLASQGLREIEDVGLRR